MARDPLEANGSYPGRSSVQEGPNALTRADSCAAEPRLKNTRVLSLLMHQTVFTCCCCCSPSTRLGAGRSRTALEGPGDSRQGRHHAIASHVIQTTWVDAPQQAQPGAQQRWAATEDVPWSLGLLTTDEAPSRPTVEGAALRAAPAGVSFDPMKVLGRGGPVAGAQLVNVHRRSATQAGTGGGARAPFRDRYQHWGQSAVARALAVLAAALCTVLTFRAASSWGAGTLLW